MNHHQTTHETVQDEISGEGKETNNEGRGLPKADNTDLVMFNQESQQHDQAEPSKDTGEDGGEMVEGEEDTVIY